MPAYRTQDPRHPVNVCRRIHSASLKVVKPGTTIPSGIWKRMVLMATGAGNRDLANDYAAKMEDMGMVQRVGAQYGSKPGRDGYPVKILGHENVILPIPLE